MNKTTQRDAARWCLKQCVSCENCRHISVSLEQRECSWHAQCANERHIFSDFVSGPIDDRQRQVPDPHPVCPPRNNRPGKLDEATLNRSILHLGSLSRWHPLYSRLAAGQPITLGIFGASVAQNAGCLTQPGRRCMAFSGLVDSRQSHRAGSSRRGFGVHFFNRMNASWPHAAHQMSNGATDATAAQWTIPCLFSHLPPAVNIVVLDFGSMAQYLDRGAVETIVRQLLSLETQPVLILLSVRNWCTFEGRHPTLRKLNEDNHWTKAENMCHRVCIHYGITCISVHQALEPLVRAGRQGFQLADVVQADCLHVIGSYHGVHYIAHLLEHWLEITFNQWSLASHQERLPSPLPPLMDTRNAPPPAARCFAFSSDGHDRGNGEAEEDVQGPHQNWRAIKWRSAWCPMTTPGAVPDASPVTTPSRSCTRFAIIQCPFRSDDEPAFKRLVASPPTRWFFCRRSLSPAVRKLSPGVVALVPGAILMAWLPLDELLFDDRARGVRRLAMHIACLQPRPHV